MSNKPYTKVKYTGATPGADANTYVLFATAPPSAGSTNFACKGARQCQYAGLHRLIIDIGHANSITLNFYRSQNRGVTWDQVFTSGAIAAPAATSSTVRDFAFEEYDDFKLELVNGGASQAARFIVDMALTDERAPLT